ncbi:MAG: cytochrome c family protein [Candidatus Paracaedibacteraceae bacterium]|nr:cytochrome c family protein [Candidatus Paracaedibacteraceae bacterium]
MYKFKFDIFVTFWKTLKKRHFEEYAEPKKPVDGFEVNKIMASILVALLAAKTFDIIGDNLVAPVKRLTKNAYFIAVTEGNTQTHVEKEILSIKPLLAKANIENGEKVFKKCIQCHVIEKGKPHGIGPSLLGVVGRTIASITDYSYSSAMKEKSNGTWDVETLNYFLNNPRKFVKGTKMTFLGLDSDQERADVIAYLQKNS